MTKEVRAALYARVSTSGHGQDVGLQLDELRRKLCIGPSGRSAPPR
jgi:predicted site-specific integrase-resolvase